MFLLSVLAMENTSLENKELIIQHHYDSYMKL